MPMPTRRCERPLEEAGGANSGQKGPVEAGLRETVQLLQDLRDCGAGIGQNHEEAPLQI